jgi:hypothetical protein
MTVKKGRCSHIYLVMMLMIVILGGTGEAFAGLRITCNNEYGLASPLFGVYDTGDYIISGLPNDDMASVSLYCDATCDQKECVPSALSRGVCIPNVHNGSVVYLESGSVKYFFQDPRGFSGCDGDVEVTPLKGGSSSPLPWIMEEGSKGFVWGRTWHKPSEEKEFVEFLRRPISGGLRVLGVG